MSAGARSRSKLISLAPLAMYCRSVAILQLLADFGLDYKSGDMNILGQVNRASYLIGVIDPQSSFSHICCRCTLKRREILDWLLDGGLDINGTTN